MPLAFESASHGTVAFGFFNIETDMLLLDRLFFFADRFCEAVIAMSAAAGGDASSGQQIDGWRLDRGDIGNLHGAIAGVDHSGFIGATYRLYPFPSTPDRFRQSPEGQRTQAAIAELIAPYGVPTAVGLCRGRSCDRVEIGEYGFSEAEFARMIAYVERGGYPRWKNEEQPVYVVRMTEALVTRGRDFCTENEE